ncbi:RHS repeat-associated core domain [Bergeyella zoohelcum]|nr:RHS repeat-associated core domain [Bergeyella zoohelcum]
MNGRLYDPLLRRFLNADEHIQDPYNTQNYNKYGYVYNNPLMYNDPSGEFVGFIFGAIKIISAIFSAVQIVKSIDALVTGTIDAFQFVKGLFFMAVSKIASVGLGDVFKAGGFWETVGNGALAGAGGGGVQALMNNENFFKGLVKGAVIGGSIAAVSYGLGKLFEGKNSVELDAKGDFSYDGQQFSSKQELLEYIQKNNGDVNTIMRKLKIDDVRLVSSDNLPHSKGSFYKLENGLMKEYIRTYNQEQQIGQTLAKVVKSESETILYVSPGLKGIHINGHYMAKSILNHEFIHARHMMLGLNNTRYLERSAWSYNYAYARYHNLPVNGILKHLNSYGGFHIPKNYMWSNLGLDKFLKLF